MRIRPEAAADYHAVRAVNAAAFDSRVEADLVEALRRKGIELISLVADEDAEVIGHILFSPVSLAGHPGLRLMGLGPMAVAPRRQRQGIGTALIREGLEACRRSGCDAVVVLGHANYYPRFGFVPAARYALRCEYDVPEDVFLVTELKREALRGASGLIRYDEAFGQ